jgi:hypothetical protein
LGVEFFKDGKVVEIIGITPARTIYVNNVLYGCDLVALKRIDRFSFGLSRLLCLD